MQRVAFIIISIWFAAILISQITISVVLFPLWQGISRTWPFLDYPMFAPAHYEGERMPQLVVIGKRIDTQAAYEDEIEITSRDLGLGDWAFSMFIRALLSDDQAAIREFVDTYEKKNSKQLAWLRVDDRGPLFEDGGLHAAEPSVVVRRLIVKSADQTLQKK